MNKKFELASTKADSEGRFKLETLACSSDMEHYAKNRLGREPAVGEEFSITTAWPAHKEGLAATTEDYEKYGTREASGIFRRIA